MAVDWIHVLFRVLFESSIRALALAVAVAAILHVARVRSSAVRHAAWTGVLVAMLAMPVWPLVMPSIVLPELSLPNVPLPEAMIVRDAPPVAPVRASTPAQPAAPSAAPAIPTGLPTAPPVPLPPYIRSGASLSGIWPATLAIGYLLGCAVFLGRLAIGWRAMRRVARASRPSALAVDGPIYESPAVATPLTLGVVAPRIVLPATWTTWSEETRGAVLAHERAHVRRRDPLVSLLAHLNRCVFWCHPLAWWLERTLAETAEEACDDAGVRAVGEPGRYAEVLIAVADAVRHQGGRVAWQGLGVNGTGLLSQRIDRVLRGELSPAVSWRQTLGVGVSCAAAIVLAVACQAQSTLEPDPEVEAKMAAETARRDAYRGKDRELAAMTAEQAPALETALVTHPDDLIAREKLLTYYQSALLRTDPERWAVVRRPHALWLIEHRPDADLTARWGFLYPWGGKGSDPAGYAAAEKLWIAQAAKPDVSARTLRTGAQMLRNYDAPRAEAMLLRGQTLQLVDPSRPDASWSQDLGWLYATVVARDAGAFVRDPDEPSSNTHPYALTVRKKLAESADPVLLAAAGGVLSTIGSRNTSITVELHEVGLACVNRALQLEPQSKPALHALASLRETERWARIGTSRYPRNPLTPDQLAALSDADRFWLLPQLAQSAEVKANEAAYAEARRYAQDALALAPKFQGTADYAPSVFAAHMTLGLLDIRAGHRPDAVAHLLAASTVPAFDKLQTFDVQHNLLLVALLKDNERDAVVTFLERMAKISPEEKDKLLESATKIRQGLMPEWYQRVIGSS